MDTFSQTKTELLKIIEGLDTLFASARSIPGMADHSFEDWEKTCRTIHTQIAKEILRVAVVGPIKSGKSSFANSLLGGDYLKRGAGVVTSIVTRVRCGRQLRADLFFKTWDDVNAEIRQALVLLPSLNPESGPEGFDIRRSLDREQLQLAIDRMDAELLISGSTRNASSVLLSSYLNGYDRVSEKVGADHRTVSFSGDRFAAQRDFSGDDNLAVYLRDISLEIDSDAMEPGIEIADCQGSDSPNPLHLAMIQDYLLLTHLIVYVISSRTGLRQADIRFLSMIKKMGIMDNTIFVLNVDFNEHDGPEDLQILLGRVEAELSMLKPAPEIYACSALFNLFRADGDRLAVKESQRLAQWSADPEMVRFSDEQSLAFKRALAYRLTVERSALLLENHVARLAVVADGAAQWHRVSQDLMGRDAAGVAAAVERVREQQEKMHRVKAIIRNTLDGAGRKLESELKAEADRFFSYRPGGVLAGVVSFIHDHGIDFTPYVTQADRSGFNNALYSAFQEFRGALDGHMAETVNPEIIRFAHEQEQRIRTHLEGATGPYEAMAADALSQYADAMARHGAAPGPGQRVTLPDMATLRTMAGISLPPADTTMRYSARIRTEAVLRLGFYSAVKWFKKVLRKPLQDPQEEKRTALADGMARIRRETENSMRFHFKSYRENFKFQYLVKLVDAAAGSLYEAVSDRFQAYVTDLSTLSGLMGREAQERQQTRNTLADLARQADELGRRIQQVRETLERRPSG
ncbi:MAG: dynamin family protein [Desulfobacterales bacterium]|nr:dynamin family protein [Desulfobacterales bacterium]